MDSPSRHHRLLRHSRILEEVSTTVAPEAEVEAITEVAFIEKASSSSMVHLVRDITATLLMASRIVAEMDGNQRQVIRIHPGC